MGVVSGRFLPESSPRLVSLPGQAPLEYRFEGERIVIGSATDVDFIIDDGTVAPRHAEIVKRRGRYFLTSLVPEATFVNGRPVKPGTEVQISRADDIQFGSLHFTFFVRQQTPQEIRRAFQVRLAIEGALAVGLIAFAVSSYFVQRYSHYDFLANFKIRHSPSRVDLTWMQRLNHYRMLDRLAPVNEDRSLSKGAAAHARYVVKNHADMIRSGKIDASIHTEDPDKPFYTPEGKKAGEESDIDVVYTNPPEDLDATMAIENWITGPLHRMWMMNPRLHDVGYAQYCEGGVCASVLNVRSGVTHDRIEAYSSIETPTAPVMFPPEGATIENGTFSSEEAEWPDPLAACGYQTPSGLPITLQVGGDSPVKVEQTTIMHNGKPIESCSFDSSSYKSSDPVALRRTRKQLAHFGAIVVIPKQPLAAGTYTVSIKTSQRPYEWWFKVEPQVH